MYKNYRVHVPATTANIGSGFDTLGIALGLYNEIEFYPDENCDLYDTELVIKGEGISEIFSNKENLILQAMDRVGKEVNQTVPGGVMKLLNRIPLARGLGSSSAALVSGAMLANQLTGNHLKKIDILRITAEIEGHPDNVAPAIMGGFCISLMDNNQAHIEKIDISSSWKAVVAIPDFELATEKARNVLPNQYERKDVIFNFSRISCLIAAITVGKPELLRYGMDDKIHVPYRIPLIPGAKEAMNNAITAKCYGVTISGSGPTLVAFSGKNEAVDVGNAMVIGFSQSGVKAKYLVLDFDSNGATIEEIGG